MNPLYADIVKRHRPRGYRLREIAADKRRYAAQVSFTTKQIICPPIDDNFDLLVFLHECGHVHAKHVNCDSDIPHWRNEYEADQYAINALRASEFQMDLDYLREAKHVLREIIEFTREYDDHPIDDEVLKYAYGREWRKHQ